MTMKTAQWYLIVLQWGQRGAAAKAGLRQVV